ncbi:Indole-3-glycerol phosphate synthase [Lactiplantibacillus plantarum]|uniref:hypothetical protein n=1 Tax=Lactiplantibacillus plantarum TaxID=1590 RepID=UPI000B3CFAC8|nr:hypothetical protein [Lactiplantibacillus plantarum]OUT01806.1 Indole-3-glycerol phosphate synthase [Lactiplantibacillus plantarum]
MASELEKLDELQRKLNERKRKARTKEYQKLGREFYQKSQAKTFAGAHQMLDHIPMFQQSAKSQFNGRFTINIRFLERV